MIRKTFKVFLLLILMGVPVSWYLFLQFYGENQFDLPVIDNLDVCDVKGNSVILVKDLLDIDERNEFNRIEQAVESTGFELIKQEIACLNQYDDVLFLIDKEGRVRGSYLLTIQDIDDFKIELELLMMLQSNNGN